MALVGWFVISWPTALVIDWDSIVENHAEVGYLIADLGIITPLSIATAISLFKQHGWAPLLLLITIGAIAYDVVHFFVYQIQEEFLSIPAPVYVVIIFVLLSLLAWLARKEIGILTETE